MPKTPMRLYKLQSKLAADFSRSAILVKNEIPIIMAAARLTEKKRSLKTESLDFKVIRFKS
jgi:hypothetical protein